MDDTNEIKSEKCMDEIDKTESKKCMDEIDKTESKKCTDDTDKIKLKNCTIIDDVVVCSMERKDYKKMKNPPDGLEINLEDEVPKNKSIDSSKRTEETTNKKGCGCSVSTENAKTSVPDAKIVPENERTTTL